MISYHVDLDTLVDHALEPEDLEALLDTLHPYGAAISGGLDERLSVSMTIRTPSRGPQDATGALELALQLLQSQVRIVTVEQAQVSTEHAKDADLAQHHRRLPRMVTVADIAATLGITRQGARKVLQTDPTAPKPALSTSLGDLYLQGEVEVWAATRGKPEPGRRSKEDQVREAVQRTLATLDHAREEVRKRSYGVDIHTEPITLRIQSDLLDEGLLEEVMATRKDINAGSHRHGVRINLVSSGQGSPGDEAAAGSALVAQHQR